MTKLITKGEYEKLKEKLKYLETAERKGVADALARAADFGDLSENAAYEDAKERQSILENKIIELRSLSFSSVLSHSFVLIRIVLYQLAFPAISSLCLSLYSLLRKLVLQLLQ